MTTTNIDERMMELRVLGPTEVVGGRRDAQPLLSAPKRLGLLVYLALARPRGFHRRDTLLALFWPDLGQVGARNALSNLLYHIRQILGPEAIENRGAEELRVRPERVWVDAEAFERKLDAGETVEALALYRGDLLGGFHVSGASPQFGHWLDRERERLVLRAAEASWALADAAEAAGDAMGARRWAERAAMHTPLSDEAAVRLIGLLHRLGDRAAALRAYEDFARRLASEWEMEPADSVQELVARVRGGSDGERVAAGREDSSSGGGARRGARHDVADVDRSVAVLPFDSLDASGNAAFADGIHSDLLVRLSAVSGIHVISRTSVRSYRNQHRSLKAIGAALRVRWVVEGEVKQAANQVQVNVRLIDVSTDRPVWAHDYQRLLTAEGVFQIQSGVTREIVRALQTQLTPDEVKRIDRQPTHSLEAYRLYVQGRRHLDDRTESGMRRALHLFQQATEHDPTFALAWVGTADAHSLLHDYGYESVAALQRAEEALLRALDLEPDLAEAHAAHGLLHTIRHEGEPGVRALRRALALRPSYAEAHNWLSWLSSLLGYRDDALESARRAVALNPLSPEAVSNLALALLVNGSATEALAEARRDRDLGSTWGTGRFYEALALYQMRRFDEAAEVLRDLAAPWAGDGPRATRAVALLAVGAREDALSLLHEIERGGDRFAAGLVYLALADVDRAFMHFDAVARLGHWPTLALRHFYPDVWAAAGSDPRLRALQRRLQRNWGLGSGDSETSDLDPRAVAVLPFEELGDEAPSSSFAAGLHNDLLTRLSRLGQLTVIARSSVMHDLARNASISEVARNLGAGTVVEGGVQQKGNLIRVSIQVIDARKGAVRWADTFDREITADNLFHLQSDLAARVAQSVQAELTPAERQEVARYQTNDLDAYRLYARGRSQLDLRTGSAIREAAASFREAIDYDPAYALAWAGLADAASLLEFYGLGEDEADVEPVEIARRAVDLGPELGECHAALGIALAVRNQAPAALEALRRSLELVPGQADAYTWISWLLLCTGEAEAALHPGRLSVRLSPLAPALRVYLAEVLLVLGRTDEALEEARRARGIQPDYGLTHFMEALVLYHAGRFAEARAALDQARPLVHANGTPSRDEVRTLVVLTHLAEGDLAGALGHSAQAGEAASTVSAGLINAALGKVDEAFAAFEAVTRWGSFESEYVRYLFPEVLGPLRNDARYSDIVQRIDTSWGLSAS